MSSYFEEHDCGENEGENSTIDLLILARMFMRNEGIIEMDIGRLELADRNRLLNPPTQACNETNLIDQSFSDEIKSPPASRRTIEELPRKATKSTPIGKTSCPVCLENYENKEVYVELPCMHKFHEECIFSWLKQTNSCPVCRYELPTDNPEYEELRLEREREKQRPYRVETLHSSMFC